MKRMLILSFVLMANSAVRGQVNDFYETTQLPQATVIEGYCLTDSGGMVATTWDKNFIHDSNGNVVDAYTSTDVAGAVFGLSPFRFTDGSIYSYGTNNVNDMFVCKGDQSGNIVHATRYTGSNYTPTNTVAADDTSFTALMYNELARFDTSGSKLFWNKIVIDSGFGISFKSMCITPQKEYLLVGDWASTNIYLAKFDSLGNFLWARSYNMPAWSQVSDVAFGADNSYYITGHAGMGAGSYDYLVMKTDTSGNILFVKTYGDAGHNEKCKVMPLPDSSVILAGTTFHWIFGPTDADVTITRIDRSGSIMWSNIYGMRMTSSIDYRELLFDLQPLTDSTFAVAANIHYISLQDYWAAWIFTEKISGDAPHICERKSWNFTANQHSVTDTSFSCTVQPLNFPAQNSVPVKTPVPATTIKQCVYVGVQEAAPHDAVQVYPNPASDVVKLDFGPDHDPKTISIYDCFGSCVLEIQSTAAIVEVSCLGLPAGVYFLRASITEGRVLNSKIVIR